MSGRSANTHAAPLPDRNAHGQVSARQLLVLGMPARRWTTSSNLRRSGGRAARAIRDHANHPPLAANHRRAGKGASPGRDTVARLAVDDGSSRTSRNPMSRTRRVLHATATSPMNRRHGAGQSLADRTVPGFHGISTAGAAHTTRSPGCATAARASERISTTVSATPGPSGDCRSLAGRSDLARQCKHQSLVGGRDRLDRAVAVIRQPL